MTKFNQEDMEEVGTFLLCVLHAIQWNACEVHYTLAKSVSTLAQLFWKSATLFKEMPASSDSLARMGNGRQLESGYGQYFFFQPPGRKSKSESTMRKFRC